MNILKLAITTIILFTTTSANAWWGPFDNHNYDGYNNGNGSSSINMMREMTGDIDFTFDIKIKGRGFGNMFNNWNNNNISSYNGYAPYRYGQTSIHPINAK